MPSFYKPDCPPRKNWRCIPNSGALLPAPEVFAILSHWAHENNAQEAAHTGGAKKPLGRWSDGAEGVTYLTNLSTKNSMTLFLRDPMDMRGYTRFVVDERKTLLMDVFQSYTGRMAVPTDRLKFLLDSEYHELPVVECDLPPWALDIRDGAEIILVASEEPSSGVVDLTKFMKGSEKGIITVTLKEPDKDGIEFKIHRDRTPLDKLLDKYPSRDGKARRSLQFVIGARRLPFSKVKPSANGITDDRCTIHVLQKVQPPSVSPNSKKISVWFLDVAKNEKRRFSVGRNSPFRKVIHAYAGSVPPKPLRFLHGDTVLHADMSPGKTASKLGIQDGHSIYVLTKQENVKLPRMPGAVLEMMHNFQGILDPIVQVIDIDHESKRKVVSSHFVFCSL